MPMEKRSWLRVFCSNCVSVQESLLADNEAQVDREVALGSGCSKEKTQ